MKSSAEDLHGKEEENSGVKMKLLNGERAFLIRSDVAKGRAPSLKKESPSIPKKVGESPKVKQRKSRMVKEILIIKLCANHRGRGPGNKIPFA